jgi:hypothetical protein
MLPDSRQVCIHLAQYLIRHWVQQVDRVDEMLFLVVAALYTAVSVVPQVVEMAHQARHISGDVVILGNRQAAHVKPASVSSEGTIKSSLCSRALGF